MSSQDVTRFSLCSGVKECGKKVHTTLSFPNPLSECWGCSKILLSFLMRFYGHFWPNQQHLQCLHQFESILDVHLHLVIFYQLPSVSKSRIPPENVLSVQSLIPISHFAPILLFLLQTDRLLNTLLWQLSVHFRHPWRIKKTNFTRQVITRTLSKINKRTSVCERMLVDST